jgi:tetratricopeptide (TPR) repeat protein
MQGLGRAFALRERLRPALEQESPLKAMHLALARLHALRPEPSVRQRRGLLSMLAAFFRSLFRQGKSSPQVEAEPAPSGLETRPDPGTSAEGGVSTVLPEPQAETVADDEERPRAASVRPQGEEPDLPATAAECEKRGEECRQRGDGEAAERFLARALQLREKMPGPEHADVARVCNSLGELYKRMGELDKAAAMHERSLAIREGLWGGEHQEVAQSCTNLGSVYRQMGRFTEAEGLYRRALELDELLLGPEDPETATDFNNLAVLHFSMERYAEALRNIRRSIAIRELALGDAHPHLAQAFENCAVILRKLGRNREADEMKARGSEVRARFEKLLAEQQNG